jgi:hypothetical protein
MVYGPIAAFLGEMFPVKIRYTSMSLPYHVGNGIFWWLTACNINLLVTNAKDLGHPECIICRKDYGINCYCCYPHHWNWFI